MKENGGIQVLWQMGLNYTDFAATSQEPEQASDCRREPENQAAKITHGQNAPEVAFCPPRN